MKLLIGGSNSKFFHLQEFSEMLQNYNIETKLVFDADYADGFPSRKISNWFKPNSKFDQVINDFEPDVIFVDRQRHFGLEVIKKNIPLLVHLRGDHWAEIKMATSRHTNSGNTQTRGKKKPYPKSRKTSKTSLPFWSNCRHFWDIISGCFLC